MKCKDRLLIVGISNNICTQIFNIYNKNRFINESVLPIGGDGNSLVHSVLIEDNILYIIDSFHNVLYKYKVNEEELTECYTGRDPRHLCSDKYNVYVTNFESDNIAVIDKLSLELQGTIPAGIKPHDVKISDNFNDIFISCYDENRVVKYNIKTGEKRYYATDGMPMHLVVDNDYIYVLTYHTNGVVKSKLNVLNMIDGSIEKTYILNGLSTIIDYDDDSKKIYILNIEYECLYVIDTEIMKEIKKIYLGGYPEDISIGQYSIFVINSTKKLLTAIDKQSLQVYANIELEYMPQCISVL